MRQKNVIKISVCVCETVVYEIVDLALHQILFSP